jgi:putative aminopeptidase FrvX
MNPNFHSFVCLIDSKPTLVVCVAAAHDEPGRHLVRWTTQSLKEADVMRADVGFLSDLVLAPGPSGFEQPVQQVVRERVASRADPETDVLGNVTATINPGATPQIVVAGHADQIGLQVTWVDDQGFVYFDKIGGVDPLLLPGRAVVIHARQGAVEGVVGKRPTHLIPEADRGKAADISEQWIDIGATDRAAALARIACGDPVTFSPHFVELAGGVVAGCALDDRCGVYVAVRALEIYADAPGSAALTMLSTVQEESRYMGAHVQARRGQPDCMIVVDADFATDQPEVEPRRVGGTLVLGGGPGLARGGCSNPRLFALFEEVAASAGIAVQIKATPGDTQTDSEYLQTAGVGTAALNIGLPMRYMHSPHEVAQLDDLEAAARLVAAVARRLGEVFEPGIFTPRV